MQWSRHQTETLICHVTSMLEDRGDDTDADGDDGGSGATLAPSELARSLGHYRSELQLIRHRLHGQGGTPGITGRLTAVLMWVALQVTHSGVGDPVIRVFLANLGEGEGKGGSRGRGKPKRQQELSNFQTPRFRQQPPSFGGGGGDREGGRAEGDGEGEGRGQARRRTAQLDPSTELARSTPAPGANCSDGKGEPTRLV